MASELAVKIVTPDEIFYEGTAEMIIVRTTQGDRGILKNHRPMVAGLSEGTLRLKKDGKFKIITPDKLIYKGKCKGNKSWYNKWKT